MSVERDFNRDMEQLDEQNDALDAKFNNMSRKARNREMEDRYGPDWKQLLRDGLITLTKKASHMRVNKNTMEAMHGGGSGQELRNLSNPAMWRGR